MKNKIFKTSLTLGVLMLLTASSYAANPSVIPKPLDMVSLMLKCFTKFGLVTQVIFGGAVAFMIIIKALPFFGISLGVKPKSKIAKKTSDKTQIQVSKDSLNTYKTKPHKKTFDSDSDDYDMAGF